VASTAPCSMCTGCIMPGVKRPIRQAFLHLVPRLRNSGAVPLLPSHLFMAWTGKYLRIYLCSYNKNSAVQSFNTLVCPMLTVFIKITADVNESSETEYILMTHKHNKQAAKRRIPLLKKIFLMCTAITHFCFVFHTILL
jgi:hypothetical protein